MISMISVYDLIVLPILLSKEHTNSSNVWQVADLAAAGDASAFVRRSSYSA